MAASSIYSDSDDSDDGNISNISNIDTDIDDTDLESSSSGTLCLCLTEDQMRRLEEVQAGWKANRRKKRHMHWQEPVTVPEIAVADLIGRGSGIDKSDFE